MRKAIRDYWTEFLAIIGVIIFAFGAAGYIISQQEARPRIPLIEGSAFKIQIEMKDARAVTPGQGQEIHVAGVQIGKVGAVQLEEGKAIIEADLDPKYKGLVRTNASALLRPKTGLKDMFVEIDPGSKSMRPLQEEERIPLANTAPDIDPDEILSALDSNTRAYLQLLIDGGGKGLENHGTDLRQVLRRLKPLHRDLARVTEAIAERRSNLRTLIHNYGSLTTRLAREPNDLKRLVSASNETLGAFADESQNISQTIRELPPTLDTTATTLGKVERLGRVLGPAVNSLRPAFRQLPATNAELLPLAREGTPIVRDQIRPFVRRARPYVRNLRPATVDLSSAAPDLDKSLLELNRFFNLASYNENGAEGISKSCELAAKCTPQERNRKESYLYWIAWLAQTGNSIFSTGDASGPFRRAGAFVDCSTLQNLVQSSGPSGRLFPIVFGLGGFACPSGGSGPSPGGTRTVPGVTSGSKGKGKTTAPKEGPLPGGVGAKAESAKPNGVLRGSPDGKNSSGKR